jgi:hypothetical protein
MGQCIGFCGAIERIGWIPIKDIQISSKPWGKHFYRNVIIYQITKYKYFELLCIKQETGPLQDNEFTVEVN